jgi:hypothetical protein
MQVTSISAAPNLAYSSSDSSENATEVTCSSDSEDSDEETCSNAGGRKTCGANHDEDDVAGFLIAEQLQQRREDAAEAKALRAAERAERCELTCESNRIMLTAITA